MTFDAVSIEYAFAALIGNSIGSRGECHDADVFRGGDPARLAKALKGVANALETKASSKTFTSADKQDGGSKARIDVAIHRLRRIADTMSSSKVTEPEDYHWEIVGALVSTVAALLEKVP